MPDWVNWKKSKDKIRKEIKGLFGKSIKEHKNTFIEIKINKYSIEIIIEKIKDKVIESERNL